MRTAERSSQVEWDRQVLRHILAMIFYMAVLFGPELPRPFRLHLLRTLRPAGPAARESIVALTPAALAPVMISIAMRYGDPEEIPLDVRLYALGLMLATLAKHVGSISRAQASRYTSKVRNSPAISAAIPAPTSFFFNPGQASAADDIFTRLRSPP